MARSAIAGGLGGAAARRRVQIVIDSTLPLPLNSENAKCHFILHSTNRTMISMRFPHQKNVLGNAAPRKSKKKHKKTAEKHTNHFCRRSAAPFQKYTFLFRGRASPKPLRGVRVKWIRWVFERASARALAIQTKRRHTTKTHSE